MILRFSCSLIVSVSTILMIFLVPMHLGEGYGQVPLGFHPGLDLSRGNSFHIQLGKACKVIMHTKWTWTQRTLIKALRRYDANSAIGKTKNKNPHLRFG